MPAAVSEAMPQILARLENILKTNAPQVLAALQPGLSAGDISKLEQQYHVQLPDDVQAIYEWHDGACRTNYVDGTFMPLYRFVPLEETLEENAAIGKGATAGQRVFYEVLVGYHNSWICIFSDDAGNGYFYDPKRKEPEGAVFYNFMEESDYTFFPSAKNLMAGIAKCYELGIFRVKTGSSPPQLDEDFDRSTKVWEEFGASNQH